MVNTNTGTMSVQEVEQGQHDLHHVGWRAETSSHHHQRLPNVRKKKLDMCIMDSTEKKVNRHCMNRIQG
jgi:hypothetical protein